MKTIEYTIEIKSEIFIVIKKVVKSLLVLILLLYSYSNYSYNWNRYGPSGMDANNICFDVSGNHIICASDGFYIGMDTIGFWTFHNYGSLPVWEAVSLDNENILLVMGNGTRSDGVYKFNLFANELTVLEWFINPHFLFIDPSNNKYYAGSDDGLYVSQDGINWSIDSFFISKPCFSAAIYGDRIVVSTSNALFQTYYTDDNGQNWHPSTGTVPFLDLNFNKKGKLYGIFPDQSNSSGLYSSNDKGTSWNLEFWNDNLSCVGFDAVNTVFVGWDHPEGVFEGIAIYDSIGSNFFYLNDGLPNTNINKIKHNHKMSSIAIFCCTDSGVYYTNDYVAGIQEGKMDLNKNYLTNYPNPFYNSTTIEYFIQNQVNSPVRFSIYNMNGELIEQKEQIPNDGLNTIIFDAALLESGIYIYRIELDNLTLSNKMTLIE